MHSEAICASLEDYNEQIEKLKQEMNDATHGADNIRSDISAPAQRYAVIKRNEECGVCQKKILDASGDYRMSRAYTSVGSMAPFYVFPCGHSFHSHCLIAHVTKCTTETQAEYILDLQKLLTLLSDGPRREMNGSLKEEDPAHKTSRIYILKKFIYLRAKDRNKYIKYFKQATVCESSLREFSQFWVGKTRSVTNCSGLANED